MKKLFYSFIVLSLSFNVANAQLPNGGLEDWTITTVGITPLETPDGYLTTDMLNVLDGGADSNVVKTTDANTGTYAALLENQTDSVAAVLFAGTWDNTTFESTQGFPSPAKATKFKGAYKRNLMGTDTGAILIIAQKDTTDLGFAFVILEPGIDTTYQSFSENITYTEPGEPDTFLLVVITNTLGLDFSFPGMCTVGSQIYVDDFSLELPSGIEIPLMSEYKINTYPNPSSDFLIFDLVDMDDALMDDIKVYSIDGKEVSAPIIRAGGKTCIDLSNLSPAQYIYQVFGENNEVFNAGSFNVSR